MAPVTRDDVLRAVVEAAEAHTDITPTALSTLGDLGFDSLDRLAFAYRLEERFPGLDSDRLDWDDRTTIGTVVDTVLALKVPS